jgi:anti-sigma factor RsiW
MTDRPYITCRELIEFLHLYLDGELPPERVAEFERHLSVCESCVSYLATYKAAIALGKATCEERGLDRAVGADVPEDLIAVILLARRGAK